MFVFTSGYTVYLYICVHLCIHECEQNPCKCTCMRVLEKISSKFMIGVHNPAEISQDCEKKYSYIKSIHIFTPIILETLNVIFLLRSV